MEGVGVIVRDCQQTYQHSVTDLLQGGELHSNNRLYLPEFFLCFGTCTPARHSKENGACNSRLIKHIEQPAAYVEESVGRPLQLVIQLNSQILAGCDCFNISPTNADRGGLGSVSTYSYIILV